MNDRSAPLVIENLLTHSIDLRYGYVAPDTGTASGTALLSNEAKRKAVMRTGAGAITLVDQGIVRGKIRHAHVLDTVSGVTPPALSLCIPELKYAWSDAIELRRLTAADEKLTSKLARTETVMAVVKDDDNHELKIN